MAILCGPGTLDLGVEDLLELLRQTGLHAGPGARLGIAIAAPLSGGLGGRQVVSVLVTIHRNERPLLSVADLLRSVTMQLYGVRIPTIVSDTIAGRCSGCGEPIAGRPWRVNILDAVAPEAPVSWTDSAKLNPGPFEFHSDPSHVLQWMARQGLLFCRRSQVREIMRPVWLPTDPRRLGLCDGIHRDDHEFVDPAAVAADRG
jgi:hypothetical protein